MPDYRRMAVLDLLLLRIQNADKLLQDIKLEVCFEDQCKLDEARLILMARKTAIDSEIEELEKEGMR